MTPVAGVAQHNPADYCQGNKDQRQHRNDADRATPGPLVVVTQVGNVGAAGEEECQPAKCREAAQRGNKGRHLEADDCATLQQSGNQPHQQRRSDSRNQAIALALTGGRECKAPLVNGRTDHPGKRQHRTHREVNATCENDKGHADGKDAVDRDLAHDVEQIVGRQECICAQGKEDADQDQHHERPKLAGKSHPVAPF